MGEMLEKGWAPTLILWAVLGFIVAHIGLGPMQAYAIGALSLFAAPFVGIAVGKLFPRQL